MGSIFKNSALLALLLHVALAVPARSQPKKQLLFILLDGFRYDYVDRQPPEDLPGFSKFLQEGVRAKWMTTIFPSVSFPDWTTLVTGLYAESHGIVGNHIYDSEEKNEFSLHDSDKTGQHKWWASAEPIWSTATKAGMKAGVIMLSRCDVPFDGVTPDYCENYYKIKGPEIFRTNIDKGLEELDDDFDLVMVYSAHLDSFGHTNGPETEVMDGAVREIDATILYLQEQLEARNISDNVNIVIVSDHGMVSTAPGDVQVIEIDQYLPLESIEKIIDAGAFSNIKALPGHVDEVYKRAKEIPGVEVYLHDDIPDRLHFKNHKYIYDILITANIGTWMVRSYSPDKMLPIRIDDSVDKGSHGYDPAEEKMRTIFFAKGPDFKSDETIDPIRSIDVYPLLAHLLDVTPNPHNGSLAATSSALITEDTATTSASIS